jgi:hypothetical protein
MTFPHTSALLIAIAAVSHPGVASGQSPSGQPPTVQDRWPETGKPLQAEPLQESQPQAPRRKPAQSKAWIDRDDAPATTQSPAPRLASVVTCNGVFAKDSTHLKLAIKFDSRNIVYGQVDGPEGTKINASILYPNDPKRRLEVLWNNEASRSDTSLIAINGKSQWLAPKGLRLGLAIAALEKANGRPFKMSGFGKDGFASVLGWEGGALSSLPGGCKLGLRLTADAKAAQDARDAVAGDKEFLSNDAGVRAIKPTVGEILIGY